MMDNIFEAMTIHCFKAYDVRGILNKNLDESIAYRIGRAFAEYLKAEKITIGCDNRLSSQSLKTSVINGILDAGTDVIDLGMTGTEEVYFATPYYNCCGGIEITASHNPINYNGMKMVREQSKPISIDTGLKQIREIAEAGQFHIPLKKGTLEEKTDKTAYIKHLLSYINLNTIKPIKLLVNSGNGAAGPIIDLIEQAFKSKNIPVEFIKIFNQPDGRFPNGIPNPMIMENRAVTAKKLLEHQADIGIAFDGDFDRCFFFDETGTFIDGYYLIGFLAKAILEQCPDSKIVAGQRCFWNTLDIAQSFGVDCIESKSGHSFIKETMRKHDNVVFAGEVSAHYYFKDFNYCDSGMIPWLLVIEQMSRTDKPLSEMVKERIAAFPSSGEINIKVNDALTSIAKIEALYLSKANEISKLDGLTMSFDCWRFNLRMSNTELLLRLNIETKADKTLLAKKTKELMQLIQSLH